MDAVRRISLSKKLFVTFQRIVFVPYTDRILKGSNCFSVTGASLANYITRFVRRLMFLDTANRDF